MLVVQQPICPRPANCPGESNSHGKRARVGMQEPGDLLKSSAFSHLFVLLQKAKFTFMRMVERCGTLPGVSPGVLLSSSWNDDESYSL